MQNPMEMEGSPILDFYLCFFWELCNTLTNKQNKSFKIQNVSTVISLVSRNTRAFPHGTGISWYTCTTMKLPYMVTYLFKYIITLTKCWGLGWWCCWWCCWQHTSLHCTDRWDHMIVEYNAIVHCSHHPPYAYIDWGHTKRHTSTQ